MAIGSTVHTFELDISDTRRHVYDTIAIKVAQHPSETSASMAMRVLAYALEHTEGIAMAPGLSTSDTPSLWVRDLTGQLITWIDVGTPDADRLHKASKAADGVAVYCHKLADGWLKNLSGARVHRREHIRLHSIDPVFIDNLAERLSRRNAWTISVVEETLYVETDGHPFSTELRSHPWPA